VLQTAAVIGRALSRALLAAVCEVAGAELDEALVTLRRAEFLFEAALYPHVEYAFKHPLTHEVAYQSPRDGERKTITALFADIKGSVEMMGTARSRGSVRDRRSGTPAHDGRRPPLRTVGEPVIVSFGCMTGDFCYVIWRTIAPWKCRTTAGSPTAPLGPLTRELQRRTRRELEIVRCDSSRQRPPRFA
jgi:hypothetical protein